MCACVPETGRPNWCQTQAVMNPNTHFLDYKFLPNTLTYHTLVCDKYVYMYVYIQVYLASPVHPQHTYGGSFSAFLDRLCRSVFWKSPSDASGTRNSISRSQMQYTRCLQKINSHRRSQAQLHPAHRYFIIKTHGNFTFIALLCNFKNSKHSFEANLWNFFHIFAVEYQAQ